MLDTGVVLSVLTGLAAWRRAPRWVGWGLQGLWVLWLLQLALRLSGAQAPWAPPGPAVYPPDVGRDQVERLGVGRSASLFRGYAGDQGPRVLLLGDSFTEGQGVPEAEALPAVLPEALRAAGRPAQVASLGISGVNIDEEAVLFESLGVGLAPQVVVQVWVLNDIYLPVSGDVVDFITDHRSDRPPTGWQTWDTLAALWTLRTVTTEMTRAYQDSYRPGQPGFDEGVAFLDRMGARGEAAGARMVLVIFPLLTRLDDYPFAAAHGELARAAREAGYEVVDLLDVFAGQDERELWVHPADQHPNTAALAVAAEAIAEVLAQGSPPGEVDWGCAPPLEGPSLPAEVEQALALHCAQGRTAETHAALTEVFLADQRATASPAWGRLAGISFLAAWLAAEAAEDHATLARLRALREAHGDLEW
jgi:lysophospholipase L1-like esterase